MEIDFEVDNNGKMKQLELINDKYTIRKYIIYYEYYEQQDTNINIYIC